MELILIRHAQPVRIEGGSERADPTLTEAGRTQALRLAEWLGAGSVSALWSSPLKRALETASPLADRVGLPVHQDDDLSEYDRDFPDYIPAEEMRATGHPRWKAMVEGRWDDAASIDLGSFRTRVWDAMERCIDTHPGEQVGVVCHGGVINVYVGLVLGIEKPLWFEPGYTSISRIAASRKGVRSVVTLNETAHLRSR